MRKQSEISAIINCIKNGKPEDMDLHEWNKYCKWARERAKELRENKMKNKLTLNQRRN